MIAGKSCKGKQCCYQRPFAEIKETIGGYSIVKADSVDEAVEIAKGCPV